MRAYKNAGSIESQISNVKFRSSLFDIRYSTLIRAYVFCLLFSFGCILPGCQQQKISAPEKAALEISDNTKKAEVVEITEDVLGRMHFKIDKYDPETGYIKTRPLEGAQFFEFWRSDNAGARNFTLANLHSIRRTVEINIDNRIDCAVRIQRLSMPEQHVTSSARAYLMFSRSSSALQTLRLNPEQQYDTAWIDMGRDKELEKEIVKRISTRLEVRRTTEKGEM
jgi:hypothetical protein